MAVNSNLHSTMFLLIHILVVLATVVQANLHSTMFLLIRTRTGRGGGVFRFTFHNVSINSEY